uniref:Interleukin-23 receptor n=1 Tax=Sciurus vulgaris TaxID=55149 RepID=A0A8D2D0H8_SCIVU
MYQVIIQLDVVIALHVLFSWCHGGITNIHCSGHLWVEPATVVKMGVNISIYCQAAIKNCQPRKLNFYKNGIKERSQITRINKTTAQLWYKNFMDPHASMYCTAECPGHVHETLICGEDVSSGYPPDAPKEVTCVIYEYSGNMSCTWNAGKLTYIDTKYVVHLKSLETEEEQQYPASNYINISMNSLQAGRWYLVWVQAANALGMEESEQLQIHLDDIVIPSASIISRAETINATVAKTIIHWNSETTIEKVSCEMRFKATTNQTWNIKEFDTNFTYVQQPEFYLEPNIKYVFQVRCRETGKRYWQPWSSPFFHKTPETVPQVTPKSFQSDTWNSGLLISSTLKGKLTSDNRQDIGLLSGMVFFAVILSIISLIGIFNRSLRTGIKRKILLLIPKWLHEDIPNVENSNIVKMLQEKSEFVTSNANEQVLDVDPEITEIRELFIPEEHKSMDCKENTGSLETSDCLPKSLFTSTPIVYIPDLHTGYKPQISSLLPGGHHLSQSDERDSSTPTPQVDSLGLGKNVRFKKYPNFGFSVASMNSLDNTLVLEELSLILNQGECSPLDLPNSTTGETTTFLENDSPNDPIPEQTLLPDDFVSCLGIMDKELPSINSYFPQNILENHINRISFLEK